MREQGDCDGNTRTFGPLFFHAAAAALQLSSAAEVAALSKGGTAVTWQPPPTVSVLQHVLAEGTACLSRSSTSLPLAERPGLHRRPRVGCCRSAHAAAAQAAAAMRMAFVT